MGAKQRLDPQVAFGQGSGAGAVPGDISTTAGGSGPVQSESAPGAAFCPFHRGSEPRDQPGSTTPTQAREGQNEQGPPGCQTPLPKLEIYAKYRRGQSTHDHGHPLVQRAHFTDKQTEAKQLSAGFHVPNLGPFLFSCYLKLRSSTSCWFFSPFLRQAHDWVFLPQDKHGKGASDGGSGERGCGRVSSRPSAQPRRNCTCNATDLC